MTQMTQGKNFFVALPCLMLVLWLTAACQLGPEEIGTLAGHVTIGPLTPVVQEGVPEPTPAPEIYAERQIVVFDADSQNEVGRASIDANGDYRIDLPVGTYIVDINHLGIDIAKGLPQTVEIRPQQTTQLDVDIDTGIR